MKTRDRRKQKEEHRRQTIVAVANRLFAQKSFHEVTVEDIAREAQVSKVTIHKYFKSKQILYVTLSVHLLQDLNRSLQQVLDQAMEPLARLDVLIETLLEFYQANSALLTNTFNLPASGLIFKTPPELMEQVVSLARGLTQELTALFEEGIHQRVYAQLPPQIITAVFTGLFSGVVMREAAKRQLNKQALPSVQAFRQALAIFRRGILLSPDCYKDPGNIIHDRSSF